MNAQRRREAQLQPRDDGLSFGGGDIVVTTADDSDRLDWNQFVDSQDDAEIYHRYEWRSLFEEVFANSCHYLIAKNNSGITLGVLPMVNLRSRLFGNFIVSVPCFNYCGSLGSTSEAHVALIAAASTLAAELGARHIELRHRDGVILDMPVRTDKVSMKLCLPSSSDVLWKQFSSKLRAQIRRPKKAGAVCEEGGLELLDDFYKVFSRNMRDLGTPVFPKTLFAKVFEMFPSKTRLFVVRLDGKAVAAGITIGYRKLLEIPSASALREYNRESVNMLLYWTILQHAIKEGYEEFDFGRTTVDSGTFKFKKQWGAEPQQLRWHYYLAKGVDIPQLNPSNPKFHLATRIWKRLPLPVANLLGPRIVRHLP